MAVPDTDEQERAATPAPKGQKRAASLDTVRLSHEEIAAQLRDAGVEEALLDQLAETRESEKADDDDD